MMSVKLVLTIQPAKLKAARSKHSINRDSTNNKRAKMQ